MSMALPSNTGLPFFAYGIFVPGQLAFLQLRDKSPVLAHDQIAGCLWLRNGLSLFDLQSNGSVDGAVLAFRPMEQRAAYLSICNMEPENQYSWIETTTTQGRMVNCLQGRHLDRHKLERLSFAPDHDPILCEALDMLLETLHSTPKRFDGFRSLFDLEMAYLLLWSSIERFLFMRYRLKGATRPKLRLMAKDVRFCRVLRETVFETRDVHGVDDPSDAEQLNGTKPHESLCYYYKVRCNLTHHGKEAEDYDRLGWAFAQLLPVFKATVDGAFAESREYAAR